ncbi:hypothetical protein ACJX0J_028846 [Zea mays]
MVVFFRISFHYLYYHVFDQYNGLTKIMNYLTINEDLTETEIQADFARSLYSSLGSLFVHGTSRYHTPLARPVLILQITHPSDILDIGVIAFIFIYGYMHYHFKMLKYADQAAYFVIQILKKAGLFRLLFHLC